VVSGGLEDLAREVLASRHQALEQVASVAAAIGGDAGTLIRHHGDYHLGQVLRSGDGNFMIIDFEGEPARPIPERRTRNSALRDVAGMLRSFSYAAAMAAPGSERASAAALRTRRLAWEKMVHDRFLEGYFADPNATFLPQERANSDRLVMLFELEKVFYELAYEINNRPVWIGVPLAGAARRLGVPSAGTLN
jgi:trehalose synthase-fused probable maltokinase